MKNFTQTIIFKAPVHEVFELLMDSKKHSEFTDDKAVISKKAGGAFKAYGDYITGKNLVIIKDKKIVQSWRASDWPKGVYSIVTFEFEKYEKKTRLKFSQANIPNDKYESIRQGWIDFYWIPMKKLFEEDPL